MDNRDYYQLLGITKDASAEEIKRAYRKLAMQYHPDRNRDKEEWANRKFKEINEAFFVLSDPEKRRRYDDFGSINDLDDIFGDQGMPTGLEDLFDDFSGGLMEPDILDDIFGPDIKRRKYRYRTFARGDDRSRKTMYETQNGIDLDTLFSRETKREETGVNYEIVLNETQASRGVEKELVRNGKRLKVSIPPNVKTGSKIRLNNALEKTDRQPGDIVITIKVRGQKQ